MHYIEQSETVTSRSSHIAIPRRVEVGEGLADLYLTDVGLAQLRTGHRAERLQSNCNPHLVVGGAGEVCFGGKCVRVQTGDTFVLFPDVFVRLENRESEDWHYWWLELRGARLLEALAMAGLTPDNPVLHGDFRPHLEPLLERTRQLYHEDEHSPVHPISAAWNYIEGLSVGQAQRSYVAPLSLAALARGILEHESGDAISVGDVADRLFVSRATLLRHFQAAYGETPSHYKERMQLERACRLLRETDYSVAEIAIGCGFATPQYFSRRFAQRLGTPPAQWRRNQSAEGAD